MIRYVYKRPAILFVGINPHPGSFRRGVPFSNNKMFWYLLSDAGLVAESKMELRNDKFLKGMYTHRFSAIYKLGFVNIINRPTRDVTELKKGEELPGRARISRIIAKQTPGVVCFVGRVTFEKYTGSKDFTFGWQQPIDDSKVFVMHFPLRGKAIIRIQELRQLMAAVASPPMKRAKVQTNSNKRRVKISTILGQKVV